MAKTKKIKAEDTSKIPKDSRPKVPVGPPKEPKRKDPPPQEESTPAKEFNDTKAYRKKSTVVALRNSTFLINPQIEPNKIRAIGLTTSIKEVLHTIE